jgi:hypothetical protein
MINISQYFLLLLILQKFAKQKNPLSYWDEILINFKIKITMDKEILLWKKKENKVLKNYTLLYVR